MKIQPGSGDTLPGFYFIENQYDIFLYQFFFRKKWNAWNLPDNPVGFGCKFCRNKLLLFKTTWHTQFKISAPNIFWFCPETADRRCSPDVTKDLVPIQKEFRALSFGPIPSLWSDSDSRLAAAGEAVANHLLFNYSRRVCSAKKIEASDLLYPLLGV